MSNVANQPHNLRIFGFMTDAPEVTGSASVVPTSSLSSSPSNSPTKGSSNSGAIAGGVVGGTSAAVLVAGIVSWFAIRCRRARAALSSLYSDGQDTTTMGHVTAPYPPALTNETLKLYVSILFCSTGHVEAPPHR